MERARRQQLQLQKAQASVALPALGRAHAHPDRRDEAPSAALLLRDEGRRRTTAGVASISRLQQQPKLPVEPRLLRCGVRLRGPHAHLVRTPHVPRMVVRPHIDGACADEDWFHAREKRVVHEHLHACLASRRQPRALAPRALGRLPVRGQERATDPARAPVPRDQAAGAREQCGADAGRQLDRREEEGDHHPKERVEARHVDDGGKLWRRVRDELPPADEHE
eukprot:5565328-Prymnesium_polylepis.2